VRTTLDLPETLINEAMALTHIQTKTDLIIAQNARYNDIELYAIDRHFPLMRHLHGFKMYGP
jgi:Bacterial antitoxin of type II TA system, VapB